ncbi:MAG: mechanosensitive ion channel [Desulfovibrionaceae bacterium]|nr:mechanosensitive ion channel [Desulfovibrionaceae bacterium]
MNIVFSEHRGLLDQVRSWAGDNLFNLDLLIQAGAVAAMLALAKLAGRRLNRALDARLAQTPDQAGYRAGLIRGLKRTTTAAALMVFLLPLIAAAKALGLRHGLLTDACALALAWAVIRLTTSVMANRFWARTVSWLVWSLAALHILRLLGPAMDFLEGVGLRFGQTYISALAVIKGALLAVVLTAAAGAVARFAESRISSARHLSPSVQVLFHKGLKFSLFTLAAVIALSAVGFNLTGLAVFSGAVGVGVGFGLQKVFSNLVSGVILLMDKSIKPGDVIEVGGTFGKINSLNARFVSVLTRDGKEYLIPNENLITNEVVNLSYSDRNIRLRLPVGVSYAADPRQALELLERAARETPRVLADPAPVARLMGFGDSSLDLELRIWITDPEDGVANVRGDVLLRVWDLLKEHGIEIPFPQRDLNVRQLPEIRVVPGPAKGQGPD